MIIFKLTVPTRVGFPSPPDAQRVPPRQPEHLHSHQKIDTLDSNVHVCHRDCNFRFDEGNHVVDDRPFQNYGTCLCAAFARTLAIAARGT